MKAQRVYSRRTIIAATAMLKALGHSGLTNFLLGLGDELERSASRGLAGGLDGRAAVIAQYALRHQHAITPHGTYLTDEIVVRAQDILEQGILTNITEIERQTFKAALDIEPEPPAVVFAQEREVVNFMVRGSAPPNSIAAVVSDSAYPPVPRGFPAPPPVTPVMKPRKVFVVHGHAGIEHQVARFIEKIGLEAIILHEQVDGGLTVAEKLDRHADVQYCVVCLTPDDEGRKKGDHFGSWEPRARQNVILEWGYFVGKLTRSNVCALKQGVVTIPSDFLGLIWKEFDDQGAWKSKLANELEAAGFQINWDKVHKG